jgi:hypothetical protein
VDTTGAAATLYPAIVASSAGATTGRAWDEFRAYNLTGAFASDTLATLNQSSPGSGTDYTGVADGIFHATVTAPGSLTGTQAELRYRVQNASNYWVAYFNASGDIRLDRVESGTPTNHISVAGVITASGTRTIAVIAVGNKHRVFTLSGSSWTARGSEITQTTAMDAQTTTKVVLTGGYTSSLLQVFPRTSGNYTALDE